MVSVEGTLNGAPFQATLDPDGRGGHLLRLDRKLLAVAKSGTSARGPGPVAGDTITLEINPVAADAEPEPTVPPDLRKALTAAPGADGARARATWADITPAARRDWIQWITSGKRAETRPLRIKKACDMLGKGKRRACCFDRSGMYGKGITCPVPDAARDA
ncbi:YdeI/OmpD-associated family protein [soil metagenome]